MTVGRTILLLGLPLFVLLAVVNGILLHVQEAAESSAARKNQAIAAAVTVAEFVRTAAQSPNGTRLAALREPRRHAMLVAAAASIPGLDALAIVNGQKTVLVLKAPDDQRLQLPRIPVTGLTLLPEHRNAAGRRLATALVPAGNGLTVVASVRLVDSNSAMNDLAGLILAMVLVTGVIGAIVSIAFARKVKSELSAASLLIDSVQAGKAPVREKHFLIREIEELADAVAIMASNLALALMRAEQAKGAPSPDLGLSVLSYREEAMAPEQLQLAGFTVAMRHVGHAPAGCFFAAAEDATGGGIVIGVCGGTDPASALANALRARRFFESWMMRMPIDEAIDHARRAFELDRADGKWWRREDADATAGQPLYLLSILDDRAGQAAADYAAQVQMISPAELLGDLLAILPDACGVIAACKPIDGARTARRQGRARADAVPR